MLPRLRFFQRIPLGIPQRSFSQSISLSKESILSSLDVLGDSQKPLNNIDSVSTKGIIFTSGLFIPNDRAALLIGGKVLEFKPDYEIKNGFLVEFKHNTLQFLKLINPQPDLLIIGMGGKSRLLSQLNLNLFNELGLRVELSDTKNAVKNFDLLATERPNQVGAIILPMSV